MPALKTPEPLIIPFFGKGYIPNRFPLFNALQPVGVSVVKFQDALVDGVNMEVSDIYSVDRRPAFTKYCTQQLGAGEIPQAFYSIRNLEGTVTPLVDTNVALYSLTPTALTQILEKTTSNQSFIQQIGNTTYIADGVDLYKWNGVSLTPWGLAAPTEAPVVTNTLTYPGYWIASSSYSLGSTLLDSNGNIEYCTQAGISGSSFPVWNPTLGASTTDGTVIWEQVGVPQLYWIASNPYTVPTVIIDTNSNLQLVTTAGTSNSSAPSWNTTIGGTTSDSGVTWTNIGPALTQAYVGWSWVYAFRTVSGNLSTASPISIQTGPILSSTTLSPVTITGYSITSNFATFTANNSFSAGQIVVLNGFPSQFASEWLNGGTVVVSPTNLRSTQFSAAVGSFVPNTLQSETGQAYPAIATLSGTASSNPECNSTATITAIEVEAGILTVTCANSFVPGLTIGFSGLTNAIFLNGQTLFVNSTNATTPGSATQFTCSLPDEQPFPQNYQQTADTGTATFLAVEIYRIADGGGIYYYAGAIANPFNVPIADYDSGAQTAGLGVDNGVPGINAWTNPNNVTSASSYATSEFSPPSSGTPGTFTVIQNVTAQTPFNSPSTTLTATLPNNVTSGNSLILVVQANSSSISTVADNQSNTYTLVASEPLVYGGGLYFYTVSSPATSAPTVTVTVGAAEVNQIIFLEVHGVIAASPVDVHATATQASGVGTTFNTGSITTTDSPDVILSVISSFSYESPNLQPAGYTLISSLVVDNDYNLALASYAPSSTGTYVSTWSTTQKPSFSGITAALQLNSGASTNGLVASNFPITVPAGVTPQGIKITLQGLYNGTAGDGSVIAQLLQNGNPVGNPKTLVLTSSEAPYTLGGSGDLWEGDWSSADFGPSAWSVMFTGVQVSQSGGPYTFSIRDVQAEVFGQTGLSTWQFSDINPDDLLDNEEVAPQAHQNDPPPGTTGSVITTGGTILAFWNDRVWMAVGNQLFFNAGPDCLNGINEECWPPANTWTFPGPITGLKPSAGGLIVTTSKEWWAILGGPETVTFYPERIFGNFGVLSPNDIVEDSGVIYVYTSQKQCFQVQGSNQNEIGFSVSSDLANGHSTPSVTASAWSPISSYLTVHRNGDDIGMFLSNGVESVLRFGLRFGNWSTIYQPLLHSSSVPTLGAIGSVETAPGVFTLLAGDTEGAGYIYARNPSSFTDAGGAYQANAIIGNIVAAEMGQPMVPLYFITAYCANTGTIPTVSFLPNEIAVTGTSTFTTLPFVQSEPAFLKDSQSLMSKRWATQMNPSGTPILLKHVQVNFSFGSDTVKNQLFQLGLRFDNTQLV